MALLFRLLLLAAVGYCIFRWLRGRVSRPGRGFPCATCRNCRNLFDDGVICSFGSKETFKNETHIANCRDWARR